MANGEVTISFDDVNLDNCITQGLEFTGVARCKHCKQVYTFRIHLDKKRRIRKFAETDMNGGTATTLVPDEYEVSIDFSGDLDSVDISDILSEPDEPEAEKACVPCSRCTPNCTKVKG